jgi:hypothetical protein
MPFGISGPTASQARLSDGKAAMAAPGWGVEMVPADFRFSISMG